MHIPHRSLSLAAVLAVSLVGSNAAIAQDATATQPANQPATQPSTQPQAGATLPELGNEFTQKAQQLAALVPDPATLLAEQARNDLRPQVMPLTQELIDLSRQIEEAAANDPTVPTAQLKAQMQQARTQTMAIQVAFGDEAAAEALAADPMRPAQSALLLGQFIAGKDMKARVAVLEEAKAFVEAEPDSPSSAQFVAGLYTLSRNLDAEIQTEMQQLVEKLQGPLGEQVKAEVAADSGLRNAEDDPTTQPGE